ncbi:Endochitinase [Dactylellina cionopaga]|nr:Endochitinase [Dactylellina cionopaga]
MLFESITAAAVLASSLLAQGAAAVTYPPSYGATFKNMTAVYWGQNAAYEGINKTVNYQYDLWTTCNNPNVDIVLVSFVTKFKGIAGFPVINLSNQCGNVFMYAENAKNKTDILTCPSIGDQIQQCQAIGKKILLSLGGATWNEPGWPSVQAARDSANSIWAMFGPPGGAPFKYRPFGNATMDGYDLDFEKVINKPNSDAFATLLRAKMALVKTRTFLLTAAPQCVNPDAALDLALTKVAFDAIFIQFYNNACQVSSWVKGKPQTTNASFNMQAWQTWATTKSANKSIKIFIGLLGGGLKGTTGYLSLPTTQKVVAESLSKYANFGGASFWDASVLNVNKSYLGGIRDVLTGKVKPVVKREEAEAEAEAEEAELVKRDIKSPVGGASTISADEFVVDKAPAEALRKLRRRHLHNRRGASLLG